MKLLSEVCHDIQTEPHLHPLTGEILHYKSAVQDDARVDIRAAGFCGCQHHCSFYDIRVLLKASSLAATLHKHEGEKCCAYEEHVWEVE